MRIVGALVVAVVLVGCSKAAPSASKAELAKAEPTKAEPATAEPGKAEQLPDKVAEPGVYQNPIDGKNYQADWATYTPQGGVRPRDPSKKVKLEYVRLLTSQDDLAKYTSATEVANLTKAIEAHAEKTIGTLGKAIEVMIQLKCTPTGHTVQIGTKNDPDEKVVQKLYDAVVATPPIKTTGDVEFLLHFTVAP